MRVFRGAVKRALRDLLGPPKSALELALILPRLFVLRPSSGTGLRFLETLAELDEAAALLKPSEGESLQQNLLDAVSEFSTTQRTEFEELLDEIAGSTEEFLTKMSFFVDVQDGRLREIETIRKNLDTAQRAETLEEVREQLGLGMSSLQRIVQTELERKAELCVDRDAYAARLEEKIATVERESRTDSLTGVSNRAGCIKKMETVLDYVRTNQSEYCLAMLDLNRFKMINDTLGHAAGDAALVAFCQRLEAAVGKSNFVGRLSGDEFVVIANLSVGSTTSLLKRLLEQFKSMPASFKGLSLDISFCFGICKFRKGATCSELLEEADKMLYRHKNSFYESLTA